MSRTAKAFFMVSAVLAAWLFGSVSLAGQSGTPTPATSARGYDAGGRRDPFVSLVVPKVNPVAVRPSAAPRPGAGLAGLAVSDVQLRGVVRSGANFIAILEGPDGRTFLAKRADRLMDGVIKGIEAGAVVFSERVEDAAGAVRVRDVRKALRAVTAAGGQR